MSLKKNITSGKHVNEIALLEKFPQISDICPGVISMKVIDDMILMPVGNGDLVRLCTKLTDPQVDQILTIIENVIMCLADHGYYYYDLKPQNVIYRCNGGGKMEIYLIDLGSVIPDKNNKLASTYPPPFAAKTGLITNDVDSFPVLQYELAAFYAMLIVGPYESMAPIFGLEPSVYQSRLINLTNALKKEPLNKHTDTERREKYVKILENAIMQHAHAQAQAQAK